MPIPPKTPFHNKTGGASLTHIRGGVGKKPQAAIVKGKFILSIGGGIQRVKINLPSV